MFVQVARTTSSPSWLVETVSTNQDGAEVVRGTWTNIVRGVS